MNEPDKTKSQGALGGNYQATLRARAEAQLRNLPLGTRTGDIATLFHELQVHQTELEMQNDELRRTQEELTLSRNRYFSLFDLAPLPYLLFDERHVVADLNLAAAELLGRERARLKGQPFFLLIDPAQQNLFSQHLSQVFSGSPRCQLECRVVCPDKTRRQVQLHSQPLPATAEPGRLCLTALVDLTSMNEAAEAVRASEEKYRSLITALAEGVVMQDAAGKIIASNPAAESILGLTQPQMQGRVSVDPLWRCVRPDGSSFPSEEHPAVVTLRTGKPMRQVEMGVHKPSGELTWISINSEPIFDPGQVSPRAVVYSFVDFSERKRSEETNAMLAAIVEFSDDAIIGKDLNGIITSWNRGAEKIFGYTAGEMLGTSIMRLFPADRQDEEQKILATIRRGQSVEHFETERQSKGGRQLLVSVTASPIKNGAGQVIGASKIVRDISERKQAELEAQRQAAFARFNPNPVLEFSASGEILYYNAATQLMANSLGQKSPALILPSTTADIVRDCLAVAHAHLRLETVVQGRTISWSFFPVVQNNVVHCYAGDITERKLSEETNLRLAMAVEQSAEAIVITDAGGAILYVNPAFEKTTGYSRAEALGQNPRVLKSGRQDAGFYRKMWDVLERGEIWHGHFFNKRKDGNFYEEDATISPIRNAKGTITNYVAVKRDVTREMQMQEHLRQSQKMETIGHLAGGVAHDFNNILAAMSIQIDLLDMDRGGNLRDGLKNLRDDTDRAANLVRQLLLYSRRSVTQKRNLDLNAAVTQFSKMLQRIIGEDIQLDLQLQPEPLLLNADLGMIEQVIMNLATNARHAMPKGGKLIVGTTATTLDAAQAQQLGAEAGPGNYGCLRVTDTGTGIPPEVLPRIFEPFFTTKDIGKGTGLGLASVFGIVKQHQGCIGVDNHPGQGVTFKVYFPALAVAATKVPPAATNLPLNVRGTEKILLVEDEPSLRKLVHHVLALQGYHVWDAANAREALELWEKHRESLNLLLTDLKLPGGMSGLELAQRLESEQPKLKVIFTSGYSLDTVGDGFKLKPGQNFIPKPVMPEPLLRTVRQTLDA